MFMFCSKCGKEIADDAAFCSSCGYGINGTGKSHLLDSSISSEEKERKLRAMIVFLISAMIEISAVLAMLVTKMQCLKLIIGDTRTAERFLEDAWDENGMLLMMCGFLIIAAEIMLGVIFYVLPYVKREYTSMKKQVMGSAIAEAVASIIVGAWFAYYVHIQDCDSFFVILFAALLSFSKVFVAISYSIAADVEDREKFRSTIASRASKLSAMSSGNVINNTTGLWRCGKCGTQNKNTDSFCKDCGNYK